MKITYVCAKSFYFTEGYRGRVIHAKGIVEGLLENGHEVELVSGPQSSSFYKEHKNLTIKTIGEKKESYLGELLWRKILIKYLKDNLKDSDLLILRYGFSNPLLSLQISKISRKNDCYSIIEVNSLGADYKKKIKYLSNFVRSFETWVLSYFNKVYVVSNEEKNRIKSFRDNINIITIANAIHSKNAALEQKSEKVRFVYLGVFHNYYNFEEIIKAFSKIDKKYTDFVELVMYGYGENSKILEKSSTENARIKLMGKYDNSVVTNLINRDSDILLLPYKANTIAEIGSPMKLFEYLVLGAPILASNVGQITEIIDHGSNGYIYEAGNVQSLSNLMNYLVKNKEERKKVGLNAHQEAIEKHSWKKRMGKLLSACNLDSKQ